MTHPLSAKLEAVIADIASANPDHKLITLRMKDVLFLRDIAESAMEMGKTIESHNGKLGVSFKPHVLDALARFNAAGQDLNSKNGGGDE